jgi:uncharacterized protein
MRIQIAGLPPGPQIFEHRGPAKDYLDDRVRFPEDIQVIATLLLRVLLEIEVQGHFTCDRCAQDFDRVHRSVETFYFAFDDPGLPPAADDEIGLIPVGAVTLDVSQEIRDTTILGLPSKILCRDDCRGICPDCGADLNVETCSCRHQRTDPRWDALKQLKKRES